ncbi:sulfur carrier protein ThiS [Paenibacillus antarcticus]|uniref:Thiamine biosynthesis protein ThiS n=1 Tax=Paenibacillus antarcticus TaxID=253703 RepID=A0A168PT40_9BACL|nr:sulfur carrier protein ThiS [Paenibacillus antarcticus]OAB47048.1 thiamine biosynthesis protein ThiS [Paenibacillus antarcticus]
MKLEINGEEIDIPSHCTTITSMLVHFGLENRIVIIELNKQIVDKSNHETKCLSDGDRIEIVHFVGGG